MLKWITSLDVKKTSEKSNKALKSEIRDRKRLFWYALLSEGNYM